MNNMIRIKLHFQTHRDKTLDIREYQLVDTTTRVFIIERWPMSKYSREKALGRADRIVGEMVRISDAGTQFTYTQEIPVI